MSVRGRIETEMREKARRTLMDFRANARKNEGTVDQEEEVLSFARFVDQSAGGLEIDRASCVLMTTGDVDIFPPEQRQTIFGNSGDDSTVFAVAWLFSERERFPIGFVVQVGKTPKVVGHFDPLCLREAALGSHAHEGL